MTELTFNNQQLLFVRVPENNDLLTIEELRNELFKDCQQIDLGKTQIMGFIQKSGGIVSTTIEDDVLEQLTLRKLNILDSFVNRIGFQGLELKEGDKMVVLKIK